MASIDVQRNEGAVYVGVSADTPEFAVAAILRWWHDHGYPAYPHATRLLILADGGGSNGHRPRLWKDQLQITERRGGAEPHGVSLSHRLFEVESH